MRDEGEVSTAYFTIVVHHSNDSKQVRPFLPWMCLEMFYIYAFINLAFCLISNDVMINQYCGIFITNGLQMKFNMAYPYHTKWLEAFREFRFCHYNRTFACVWFAVVFVFTLQEKTFVEKTEMRQHLATDFAEYRLSNVSCGNFQHQKRIILCPAKGCPKILWKFSENPFVVSMQSGCACSWNITHWTLTHWPNVECIQR